MTKEQEIMDYLHRNVFDPILASPKASEKVKKGVRLTITRMSRLDAARMRQYYWSAVCQSENAFAFAELLKAEQMPRLEDVLEDFRRRFNDDWLRRP